MFSAILPWAGAKAPCGEGNSLNFQVVKEMYGYVLEKKKKKTEVQRIYLMVLDLMVHWSFGGGLSSAGELFKLLYILQDPGRRTTCLC